MAENVPTLVGSGEGSPDSNKSGTPTAVKKQSKLVAMKTILSKNAAAMGENNAESKPLPEIVEIPKVPAKITIAASGTRVDLPLVTDRPESKDLTLGMGSMSLGKNTNTGGNNNSSRFELPPRFQAARLKLALGSNQQSSYNSASGGRPDGRDSADEMRQMSMPYQMPTQLLSNPVGSLKYHMANR